MNQLTYTRYLSTTGAKVVIAALIFAVIGVVGAGASVLMIRRLTERFDAALGGDGTATLESTLAGHLARVDAVDRRLNVLNGDYDRLVATNSLASQKIAIVRFNPFGDTGGDQSFALAVLDAHNSGYVLSSIHGREGTRSYVKPIDFGSSKHTLSSEEKQALALAEKRVPNLAEAPRG